MTSMEMFELKPTPIVKPPKKTNKRTAPFTLPRIINLQMNDEDIEGATCNSRTNCVIARNITRQLDLPPGQVRVSTAGVSIDPKDGYRYYFRTPRAACRVVVTFDKREPVRPIRYRLIFSNRIKIQPTNFERNAITNAARKAREEILYAMGQKPKRYPKGRYGI